MYDIRYIQTGGARWYYMVEGSREYGPYQETAKQIKGPLCEFDLSPRSYKLFNMAEGSKSQSNLVKGKVEMTIKENAQAIKHLQAGQSETLAILKGIAEGQPVAKTTAKAPKKAAAKKEVSSGPGKEVYNRQEGLVKVTVLEFSNGSKVMGIRKMGGKGWFTVDNLEILLSLIAEAQEVMA